MAAGRPLLIGMYDYLLVVGPGRSGSDFLYRILRAHPDYAFPKIKEGAYYRSVRAYMRARAKVRPAGKLLCDIANDAYHDPKLSSGVQALQRQGVSILMMILLRNHRDRALSAMRFRKSRGTTIGASWRPAPRGVGGPRSADRADAGAHLQTRRRCSHGRLRYPSWEHGRGFSPSWPTSAVRHRSTTCLRNP